LRLVTLPLAMGSPPATNTIGIVEVAALGACLGNSGFHWRKEGESDSRFA
jgi:hypothetical protein